MKKKTSKRLSLHRETLATLEKDQIQQADGAGPCHASGSCPPPPTADDPTCIIC